ncbi:MAG TPA: TraR/DksA family transcriptional regulator [Burkholderiaceae bacterium]
MSINKKDLATIEQELRVRAKALRAEISGKLGEAASDAGGMNTGGDFGDQAQASGESSLDLAEAQRDLLELGQVDAALEAIAAGNYGVCVDCEQRIPFARLKARPLATRCVACQGLAERKRADQHPSI